MHLDKYHAPREGFVSTLLIHTFLVTYTYFGRASQQPGASAMYLSSAVPVIYTHTHIYTDTYTSTSIYTYTCTSFHADHDMG